MNRRASLVLVFSLLTVCTSALAAKKPDPLAGHWELNLKKTHYGGGAQKRTQETFICTQQKDGVACTIHSAREDGSIVNASFTAKYDGTAALVSGLGDVDEIRLERVSDTIASATFSYKGSYAFAYRATRSADGKTLTGRIRGSGHAATAKVGGRL